MALLDLQAMQAEDSTPDGGKSAASKGCGSPSALSLLIC
jgi:hypothetical protein